MSKLDNKTKEIEKTASDVDTAVAFVNTEIEALKEQEMASGNKITELEDKLLYQEVRNRQENLRFFGILSPAVASKRYLGWYTSFSKKSSSWELLRISNFKVRIALGKRRQEKQDRLLFEF